jgi:hypothetical protein
MYSSSENQISNSAVNQQNNQTPEICRAMLLINKNGYTLKYVAVQTLELCLAAVRQNGLSLEYVFNKTLEICLEAVSQDGTALQFVVDQTPELCLVAVKQNGYALRYVISGNLDNDYYFNLCVIALYVSPFVEISWAMMDIDDMIPILENDELQRVNINNFDDKDVRLNLPYQLYIKIKYYKANKCKSAKK